MAKGRRVRKSKAAERGRCSLNRRAVRNKNRAVSVLFLRSTSYDRFPAVVHALRILLASGAAGADRVSVCVAVPAAISDRRYCSPRRIDACRRLDNAAISSAKRALSDRANLIPSES